MRDRLAWKILLVAGIVPFASPFVAFAYQMMVSEAWTLPEWLLLYSLIYWPIYAVGLALMAVSAFKLSKARKTKGAGA